MADVFDQAQDADARQVAEALKVQEIRAKLTPSLEATGECHNPLCGEPVEAPRLFCGPECAKEHARRMK